MADDEVGRFITQFNGINKESPHFYTESISMVLAMAELIGSKESVKIADSCRELLDMDFRGVSMEYCQKYLYYMGLNYGTSKKVREPGGRISAGFKLYEVERWLRDVHIITLSLYTQVVRELGEHPTQIMEEGDEEDKPSY